MPRGRIRWGVPVSVAVALFIAAVPASAGSPTVAAVQAALKAKGLYTAEVDGVAGPLTRAATMSFQRRRRLTVDGVAGPGTRRALGRRGGPAFGSRVLAPPAVGWDVAMLQFYLWRAGYSPGAIDGALGPGTARAVYAYQRSTGLGADGLAGRQTIRALRRGAGSHPDSPVRFYHPLSGPMGDGFGHIGGRRHTGIDFPVPAGSRIRAGGRGVVEFAGFNTGGYGNLVVVRHRLGFSSWYAHMSRIAARPGQAVNGGTLLGWVGSTGNSTGPHLHFEVRRYDTPIDPIPYLLPGVASYASVAPEAAAAGCTTRRSPVC